MRFFWWFYLKRSCRYIDVGVASAIARGDVDPLTFEPMVDIMPSFHPVKHPIQSRPLVPKDYNRRDVTDSKNVLRDKGSLLQYFGELLIVLVSSGS